LDPGQPLPESDRAGSASDSPEIRKAKALEFLTKELQSFLEQMKKLDKYANSRTYPLVWEIRTELEQSFNEAIGIIRSIDGGSRL
jgi:succinate dehydrogenase/fumarate reductase flavoprotein subunit